MRFRAELGLYCELWAIPNIRWMVIVQFLTNLTFYSTVIIAFQTGRGLNYTQIFWLESILSAAVFLFEVPTGMLADKLGYRRMMLVGQGLFVASYVLFAAAHSFGLFALSSVCFGAGLACISGCDSALVYASLPDGERERLGTSAFALLGAASSGGFFVGLATGSLMGARDPALPVVINIIPMVLAWVVSFRLRSVGDAEASGAGSQAPAFHLLLEAGRLIRRLPGLVALSLFGTAAFALSNAIFWYNQPIFTRAGVPVAWFGPLTAAAMGLQMLMALAAPAAGRRLGPGGALALSCLVQGVAYVAAGWAFGAGLTTLLVAAVVAGGAWRQPILRGELNRRIPDGARATTLSALSFIGTLAGIALNPLIGRAGDAGLQVTVLALGLGLVLLAGLFPLALNMHSRRGALPGEVAS